MIVRVAFFKSCTKMHDHEVFLSRPVPSKEGGRGGVDFPLTESLREMGFGLWIFLQKSVVSHSKSNLGFGKIRENFAVKVGIL